MTVADNEMVEARVFFDMPEQVISECTFVYKSDFTTDQSDAAVIAAIDNQLDDMWTNLVTQIVSGVQLDRAEYNVKQWNGSIWETVRNLGESIPGVTFTNANDMLPHATAPYITARTAIPKTRGRKFIPGFAETEQADSILISTALSALSAFAIDYLSNIDVGGGNLLIPVVLATVDGLARNLVSSQVSDVVGTQRRRKPGVGI